MSAPTLAEMRQMSDGEIEDLFDRKTPRTVLSPNFLGAELARRQQARETRAILRLTRWIAFMTLVVTVATVVNLVLALRA